MADRYLIVGLGNPGREYEKTRHNIGWRVIDALAAAHNIQLGKVQSKALIGDGVIAGKRVTLVKPMTYMNLSGEAVGGLMTFYKILPESLLTISDDLDIPPGHLRIRAGGSAGGQNGLRSIIQHLGTQEFARIRFGIGRPPGRMAPAAYVLQDFAKSEADLVDETMRRTLKAIETWLTDGIETSMNRYNGDGLPKPPKPAKPPAPKTEAQAAPPSDAVNAESINPVNENTSKP
jgi:PTH1 family peptidyl-tRNA hydrolase